MLSALSQLAVYYPSTNLSPNYNSISTPSSSILSGGLLAVVVVLSLAVLVLMIVSGWKIFVKAGRPGWAAIIPLYNTYVLAEIGDKPGWWGLYPLLSVIPFIGGLLGLVVGIIICIGVARNFGKSELFGVFGLAIFTFVGWPILGFGSAVYKGSGTSAAGPVEPPYPNVPVSPPQSNNTTDNSTNGSGAPKPPVPMV